MTLEENYDETKVIKEDEQLHRCLRMVPALEAIQD
jgi:hypothetical protein